MRHTITTLGTLLVLCALAAPALAQGPNQGDPVGDYREKLYIACSLVFIAITVFLWVSHTRMRRTAEDVQLLESRVGELESGSA